MTVTRHHCWDSSMKTSRHPSKSSSELENYIKSWHFIHDISPKVMGNIFCIHRAWSPCHWTVCPPVRSNIWVTKNKIASGSSDQLLKVKKKKMFTIMIIQKIENYKLMLARKTHVEKNQSFPWFQNFWLTVHVLLTIFCCTYLPIRVANITSLRSIMFLNNKIR